MHNRDAGTRLRAVRFSVFVAASCLLVSAADLWAQGTDFPRFADVAGEVGLTLSNVTGTIEKEYIVEVNGNGAAFFDYDNDGDSDVLIVNGSTLERLSRGGDPMVALYRNEDGRFEDVTSDANLTRTGWGMGVCVADYDNDGHKDFYVTAYGQNVLYRNVGNGSFDDQTPEAGVGDTRWGSNCTFGDYDRDGDVDLYVANYLSFDVAQVPRRGETDVCDYMGVDVFCGPRGLASDADVLYRNDADGSFTDVTEAAGVARVRYSGFGAVFTDFDNDGWPDIYVANDMTPNLLYHNRQDGTFEDVGLISGAALNDEGREQAGMGIGVGDYDGNGLMDVVVTHFAQDTNTLYANLGGLLFDDRTRRAGLGGVSFSNLGWGTGLKDLDNDGWVDLFVANGHVYPEVDSMDIGSTYRQAKEIYRNDGEGGFVEVTPVLDGDLLTPASSRGAAFGDYDNDGDIDILVTNINDAPSLFRNEGGEQQGWIGFDLVGVESNRDGIGARVEITVDGRKRIADVTSGASFLSHDDMRVHFGIGPNTEVDSVLVRWPSGMVDDLGSMEGGRYWTIREGVGVVSERGP